MAAVHDLLNHTLTGQDNDLWWAAIRALMAVCSIIAATAVRSSPDRYLAWITFGLGAWLSLKVGDDIRNSFAHQGEQALTVYFLVGNVAYALILISLARMASREQKAIRAERGGGPPDREGA